MKAKIAAKKQLQKSVESSSRLEGGNLQRAKKNHALIAKLKKYGRAFSL